LIQPPKSRYKEAYTLLYSTTKWTPTSVLTSRRKNKRRRRRKNPRTIRMLFLLNVLPLIINHFLEDKYR